MRQLCYTSVSEPLPLAAWSVRWWLARQGVPLVLGALFGALSAPPAEASRCTAVADGTWACTHQAQTLTFRSAGWLGCSGAKAGREVRWQVPEGTSPADGWPVVFFFQGTVPANDPGAKPFTIDSKAFGGQYLHAVFHELLDDPKGTGRRYAVVAPEASAKLGMRFWDTNQGGNYSQKDDACFFPALFQALPAGLNLSQRYAFGISSGGYNSSRMAVSFNAGSDWRALAVVSASYATCAGPVCSVPSLLPANHPPTRFFHGTADLIVPIATMRKYHDRLQAQGMAVDKVEHRQGHAFTPEVLGDTGIKAWFDRY
jgi:pimeloyl-ACP methyl ester carboxylesterase